MTGAEPAPAVPAVDWRTAGWRTAEAPPVWVLEQLPEARGWRNVGERRWRADLATSFAGDLLVLVDEAGTGFMRYALDLEGFYGDAGEVSERVFTELQERFDHAALPDCAVPGCPNRGEELITADEFGRLAGRRLAPGDQIRMCFPHADDVYRAGTGLENIAEWLRPDAMVLDAHVWMSGRSDGHPDDHIRRTWSRLPRWQIPAGDAG